MYNKAYINEQVLFNVLFAILEQPFTNSVFCILTYISFIQDLYTLIYVLNNVFVTLLLNLNITALEQEQEKLKAKAY